MPLADVRRVVDSARPEERDAAIADHLFRMERELDRTREIVASLRDLLRPAVVPEVTHRTIDEMFAIAATERVGREEIGDWCAETFAQLYQTLIDNGGSPSRARRRLLRRGVLHRSGRRGHRVRPGRRPHGTGTTDPRRRYAIAVHAGPFVDFDRTYAALGSHVAEHETAVPGADPGDLPGQPAGHRRRSQLPHRGLLADRDADQTHTERNAHDHHQPRPDRDRQRQRRSNWPPSTASSSTVRSSTAPTSSSPSCRPRPTAAARR